MNEQVTGSAALQGKEISKLAREYAEFVIDKTGHNPLAYEVREDIVEDAVNTFKWLLRDHCIVNKSHLKHVCKMIKDDLKCHEPICETVTISDLAEEQRALIVELFGTDLFKVTDKVASPSEERSEK